MESNHRLSRPSQLLAQHLDDLQGSYPLVFCPPADDFCIFLSRQVPPSQLTIFTFDYAAYRYHQASLRRAGKEIPGLLFGPVCLPGSLAHKSALIFLPKGRELVEMCLRMVAAALEPGSKVYLVGENDSGIRSYKPVLEQMIGPMQRMETGRHSALYEANYTLDAAAFVLDPWADSYHFWYRDNEITVVSFPGVFSHAKIDNGTRLLVESFTPSPQTRILDFGCGSGVIGAIAQIIYPQASVDLVDSNALALEAARLTLAANGLLSPKIFPSDIFSDISATYSMILSNPPFHAGVRTEYRVTEDFIREAIEHLEPGGSLRLVANRFLKYPPLLKDVFGNCQVVAEDNRYRVYESVRER